MSAAAERRQRGPGGRPRARGRRGVLAVFLPRLHPSLRSALSPAACAVSASSATQAIQKHPAAAPRGGHASAGATGTRRLPAATDDSACAQLAPADARVGGAQARWAQATPRSAVAPLPIAVARGRRLKVALGAGEAAMGARWACLEVEVVAGGKETRASSSLGDAGAACSRARACGMRAFSVCAPRPCVCLSLSLIVCARVRCPSTPNPHPVLATPTHALPPPKQRSDAVFRGKFEEVTARFKGDRDEIDADRNTPMQ